MIARQTEITETSPVTPDLVSTETPLQRQILLWQQELLRRAEQQGSGAGGEGDGET